MEVEKENIPSSRQSKPKGSTGSSVGPETADDNVDTAVKVAVRVRPLTPKEHMDSTNECISYLPQNPASRTASLLLDSSRSYTFDFVFDTASSQDTVYDSVDPMVRRFCQGYHTTVLAYGQTGSGKTFTMGTGITGEETESTRGIIPRAVRSLFDQLEEKKSSSINAGFKYSLSVTFLELYNEELIDLLNPHTRTSSRKGSALSIREDSGGNVYWAGIKEESVTSPDDLMILLKKGSVCRTTGSTDMNLTSSRSHAVYSIILRQEETSGESIGKRMQSKFHFVDLAGSERLKKTKASGDRAKEGISINSGLLAMGKVIHALNDGASHIPYRDSKLTRLLQDALGGNSQTLMIACVSPADSNFGETLNTLNYASRARNIKNRVVQNQDYQAMEVHQLRAEISRLKMELLTARSTNSIAGPRPHTAADKNSEEVKKENEAMISEIRRLEVLAYQLQQKNAELRQELTVSKSERDSLLFATQQGDLDVLKDFSEGGVHPMISNYQHTIAELQGQVEDLQKELKSSGSLAPTGSMVKFPSADSIRTSAAAITHSAKSLNTASSILQSPRHRAINETIDKAREEIRKERELLKSRAKTPPGLDTGEEQYESSPERDVKSFEEEESQEDEILDVLDQITIDIRIKEELVTQLQSTQVEYQSMKQTYEEKLRQMVDQVQKIQHENEQATRKFDSSNDKDRAQISSLRSRYEDRLKKLNLEMSDLKRKYEKAQKDMMNKRHSNDALANSMKLHIEALKKDKVRLLKTLKERELKARERELGRERELNNLKRKEKQAVEKAKQLERNNQMQKIMLKKRTEENVQTQSKLRSVMDMLKKTKNIASPISKRSWKFASPAKNRKSASATARTGATVDDIEPLFEPPSRRDQERMKTQAKLKKNLLYTEINNYISSRQNSEVMEELLEKRRALQSERQDLEDEISQLNSRIDSEYQRAKFNNTDPKDDVAIQSLVQTRQDSESRLEIIDAEIQYYGARLRSIQIEAAAQTGGDYLPDAFETTGEVPQSSMDTAIDLVNDLSQVEAKSLLEMMLDDIISIRMQERSRQLENQALKKEKMELQKTVEVMKAAAIQDSLAMGRADTIGSTSSSTHSTGKFDSTRILQDVINLQGDMDEIEKALASQPTSPPRGRSRSVELRDSGSDGLGTSKATATRPPFIPGGASNSTLQLLGAKPGSAAHGSSRELLALKGSQSNASSANVFERLHREQTIASQMKVRDGAAPSTASQSQTKTGRSLSDEQDSTSTIAPSDKEAA